MFTKFVFLILLTVPNALLALELHCTSKEKEYSWANSLREVVIYLDSKQVGVRYSLDKNYQMVPLLHVEGSRYSFNKSVRGKGNFTVYKLFPSRNHWRVLSAGLTNLDGIPILRAGSPGVDFECIEK